MVVVWMPVSLGFPQHHEGFCVDDARVHRHHVHGCAARVYAAAAAAACAAASRRVSSSSHPVQEEDVGRCEHAHTAQSTPNVGGNLVGFVRTLPFQSPSHLPTLCITISPSHLPRLCITTKRFRGG